MIYFRPIDFEHKAISYFKKYFFKFEYWFLILENFLLDGFAVYNNSCWNADLPQMTAKPCVGMMPQYRCPFPCNASVSSPNHAAR